ncbi:Protein SPA, chloroplastic [Dichanthelium oligosanthes]|uniref:Protein SPA, chloroplastic n=1 Tax=Dichanthelium oligosanthes TaxID=888268 RepID=A0A1E5VIA7_9POAL|nr:Protein SPA, chloroplastic [Dichanthelium oligosanthes]
MATSTSPLTTLHSSFLSSTRSSPCCMAALPTRRRRPYSRIRAIDLDQNTIVAISVGVVSIAVGIGVPVFYETQIDSAAKRENTQPCFPCSGSGAPVQNIEQKIDDFPEVCRFCSRKGIVTVILGAGETEESKCVNCEGIGSWTCTTCQGTGIQPRYLDRR